MGNQPDDESLVSKVLDAVSKTGLDIITYKRFGAGLDVLYNSVSLSEVIREETPILVEHEPGFFDRVGLNVPENPETHLFNLYHNKYKTEGLKKILHVAKVYFRELQTCLINHPDEKNVIKYIDILKKIFDGTYFDSEQ